MTSRPKDNLPDDIAALKQLVLAQQSTLAEKQGRIQFLEALVILFKRRQFGKSSEKSPQQTELFDEAENEADLAAPEIAKSVDAEPTANKKTKSGRKPLPKTLPRVRIEHDLPAHEKVCECGCQKHCIGEETSEQLDIIPAVIQVRVHARKKYACTPCESNITLAALPKQPIPKSNASPGLLAHIAVAKYQDGRLNIDNNPVENAIRPFAIGRKNWMFSQSQAGAKASAMLYSLIETAKANDLEPYAYLRTLFTRLPGCATVEAFEGLLPWNVEIESLVKI